MLVYLLFGAVFSTRVSFEPQALSSVNEGGGERFSLEGCSFDLLPGMPLMPVKPVVVALPPGATNLRLRFSAGEKVRLAENVKLERFQISRGINAEAGVPDAPEPPITSPYPAERAKLVRFGYMRGQALAVIQVFPLEVTPEGEVYLYKWVDLSLEYEKGGERPTGQGLDPYFYNVLKAIVVNPDGLMSPSWNPTNLDYVIIAPQRFLPVLDSFVVHRRLSGYSVEVYTVDWFSANFPGDGLPDRIRTGIKWLLENKGARFVLLVGDHEEIPPKMCWVPYYDSYYGDSVDTDYYYACLDGSWNTNGDWFYGTTLDNIDLFPDVFVGRLAVRDTVELKAVIAKCIRYDMNPSTRAHNYIMHVSDVFNADDSRDRADFLRQFIPDSVHEIDFVEAEHPTQTAREFLDSLETAGPGFLISMCHGNHYVVRINSRLNSRLRPYDATTVNNFPFFGILIACYYNNIQVRSIGKDYMLNPNGGAIGLLGSVKEDYPDISWNSIFPEILKNFYGGLTETEGQIDALTRMVFASSMGNASFLRTILLAYRLQGDPGQVLINWVPRPLSVTTDPLVRDTFKVYVRSGGSPCPGAKVVLYRDGVVWLMKETGPDGYATFTGFPVISGNYRVGVSKKNCIPWRGMVPATNAGAQVALTGITINDDDGDGNAHPAETLEIRLRIKNFGNAAGSNVAVKAASMDPDLFFLADSVYVGSLASGAERECALRAATSARPSQTYKHALYSITVYQGGNVSERDSSYVPIKSGKPELAGVRSNISKDTIYFSVDIVNSGLSKLTGIRLSVSSADGSTMLVDSTALIPSIMPGSNSGHTHTFSARVLFPVSEPKFRLRVSDNAGLWDTFRLRLRPGPKIDSGFASPTPNGVCLYWTKAQRAKGYKVLRGTGIAYPGLIAGTTFSDEPLDYHQLYSYTVVAVDSALNEGAPLGPFLQKPNPPHGPHQPVNVTLAWRVGPVICNMDPSYPGMEAVFNSNLTRPEWMPGGDPSKLFIVHSDGTQPPGFPLLMKMYHAEVLPAVGDIDGDGLLEYVTGDIWNDTLYAFNSDGSPVPGWPVPLNGDALHIPTPVFMQDFDGDGFPEVGLWSIYGVLWLIDGDGKVLLCDTIGGGWQRNLPATGDLDYDGIPEIAVLTGDSKLYVLSPDGSVLPGFPVSVDSLNSDLGGVAIAELVRSSPNKEIATLTSRGTLSIVLYDGTVYSQVNPYYAGKECVSQGPVIADFDGDDTLEIAYIGNKGVAIGEGCVDTTLRDTCYIISPEGRIISPPLLKQRGRGDGGLYATAGDIDGDGEAELVVPGLYGTIYAFNIDGSMVPGFPIVIQNDAQAPLYLPSIYGGVTIADQNEDGLFDLHTITCQGVYHAWETFAPFSKKGWLAWGHDRWNTRCYGFWPGDGPPAVEEVATPRPRFFLGPPMPNPSRGKLRVQFGIPSETEVTLALYDVAGRRTQTLLSGKMGAGVYQVDEDIVRPSGVYFLRLTAGNQTSVQKVVIAR